MRTPISLLGDAGLAILATAAVLAACPVAADAAAVRHRCAVTPGEHLVARTNSVLVVNSGGTYTTCYRPTGASHRLYKDFSNGSPDSGTVGSVMEVRAAGHYVAYAFNVQEDDVALPTNPSTTTVLVVDVARHDAVDIRINDDDGQLEFNQIAVSARGYLAWDQIDFGATSAVETIDVSTGGAAVVLDTEPASDTATADPFTSLAFDGETLTWLDAGAPKSASITSGALAPVMPTSAAAPA
jgi:hypothetical protein